MAAVTIRSLLVHGIIPLLYCFWPAKKCSLASGRMLLLAGFFILRFADEPVEQEHHEDSADKEAEGSENGRVVEGISHGRCFNNCTKLPEREMVFNR
jgi:hypothetical protein